MVEKKKKKTCEGIVRPLNTFEADEWDLCRSEDQLQSVKMKYTNTCSICGAICDKMGEGFISQVVSFRIKGSNRQRDRRPTQEGFLLPNPSHSLISHLGTTASFC